MCNQKILEQPTIWNSSYPAKFFTIDLGNIDLLLRLDFGLHLDLGNLDLLLRLDSGLHLDLRNLDLLLRLDFGLHLTLGTHLLLRLDRQTVAQKNAHGFGQNKCCELSFQSLPLNVI